MKLATATRTVLATAFLGELSSGYLKIYNGTRPANPNTALSGNTLLGTVPLASTAGTVSSGVLTLDVSAASDTDADASGTPTFVRIVKSDGTTVVCDLSAAVGSGEANFEDAIVAGIALPMRSASFTVPVGSA